MSLYKNSDTGGVIRSVELLPEGTGALAVLYVATGHADKITQALAARQGNTVVTRAEKGKDTILLVRSATSDPQLIADISRQFGSSLSEVAAPKKQTQNGWMNMNRVRGVLGTIGQMFQQAASYMEKNKALKRSSLISLGSNLIMVGYGTPQRVDYQKTEAMRARADKVLAFHLEHYRAPDEQEVVKDRYKGTPVAKFNKFVGANNIVISDAMRFTSQWNLVLTGENWVDRTMGALQASAKIVTFSGVDKDKDKDNRDKGLVRWLRENTNPISGALEWAGQFMNMFNSIYMPQIHNAGFEQVAREFKEHGIKVMKNKYRAPAEMFSAANWKNFSFRDVKIISPLRFTSVILFLSGFVAKMLAPFSRTTVDWHEVHKHAAMALAQVPENKREHLLVELSAAYLSLAKDKNLTFGEVYQSLRQDIINSFAIAEARAEVEHQPAAGKTNVPSSQVQAATVTADKLRTPAESIERTAR